MLLFLSSFICVILRSFNCFLFWLKNAKVDNLIGMGGGVGSKMMDENLFLGDNMLNINCLNPVLWGVQKMFV